MANAAPKLGRTDKIEDVIKYIRELIAIKFGTLTAYAEKEDVTVQYISTILSGRRPVPDWMLKRFKITREVTETWQGPKTA